MRTLKPTANFSVWDIIKVRFPYTNRPVEQHRPALLIASHFFAGSPELLWVLMITSADHRRWQGDVEIPELEGTGLPAASVVRTAKIATVEAAVATRIGRLAPSQCSAVHGFVSSMLAAALEPSIRGPAAVDHQ